MHALCTQDFMKEIQCSTDIGNGSFFSNASVPWCSLVLQLYPFSMK